jgi:hypothetical protein
LDQIAKEYAMSASLTPKVGPAIGATVHEVRASFPSDAALQDAIDRLTRAGFDRADLSLPAAHPPAAQATPERGAADPNTEDDTRQIRTMQTSMAGSTGALIAAGVVVATGGAALPALAAAAAAGLGVGGLVAAANTAAVHAEHASREAAAELGELLLSVRLAHPADQARAEAEMRAAGATGVVAVQT